MCSQTADLSGSVGLFMFCLTTIVFLSMKSLLLQSIIQVKEEFGLSLVRHRCALPVIYANDTTR
jgi:hypothetical protein